MTTQGKIADAEGTSLLSCIRAMIDPTSFSATSLGTWRIADGACAAWFSCAIGQARNRQAA
jgi:hypothetical protein